MQAELSIRREDVGTRSWRVWPAPEELPEGLVQEARSYLFELTDVDDPAQVSLALDGQQLDALLPRNPRTALWRWSPGFHAGAVEASILRRGTTPQNFEIRTDPDLRKLTRSEFDLMLREILEDSSALFALSGHRQGIAHSVGSRPPALARLEFIRSRIDEIEDTVRSIDANPRRALRGVEERVPYHRARGVLGPEVVRSFSSSRIRRQEDPRVALPAGLRGYLPERLIRRRKTRSTDLLEHRQMKTALRSWAAWLRAAGDLLAAEGSRGTAGEGWQHWVTRLTDLMRRLRRVHALRLFEGLSEEGRPLVATSLFRREPRYNRFFRLHQDMQLGLASVFGDFLQMPLARTFELYELWCFLRLVRAVVEAGDAREVRARDLFLEGQDGSLTITTGEAAVQLAGGPTLWFKRCYREFWTTPDLTGSFSRTMIPDLTLTVPARELDLRPNLIVLDAKYRIERGLTGALDSIHTYRDALVREAGSGEIEGIVGAAYLLTPHIAEIGDDYRSTPMPGRLFHPEYRRSFRFGAVELRPGMSMDQVRSVVQTIVEDSGIGFR